jgi:3-methyladenine DNA glycosylase AlkC
MPMTEIVAARGLDDFDYAMGVLAEMTKRFTSEFAVRPFLIADPERGVEIARKWAEDDNYNVRRFASEGTRPRLPWGLRLQSFVQDPQPLLPLLTQLRDDPSEYVRRSVANSLNDIAKDHPDLIAEIAADWLKEAPKNRVRLVKHACRTLIKAGHAPTLAALGYGLAEVDVFPITLAAPVVNMGGHLEFSATVTSKAKTTQPLIIDYVIHHRKANGRTTPKTFKWKVMELGTGKSATLSKRHAIKPIATRVYYAGQHAVEVQINGQSYAEAKFELIV